MLAAAVAIVSTDTTFAHESPIDHIDRTISVGLVKRDLVINYRMRMTPRAALLQLRAMDRNDDGLINDEERSVYMGSVAARIRERMTVAVGDKPLRMDERAPALMHADLSNEFRFSAPLAGLESGKHVVKLEDDYTRQYPGGLRIRALDPESVDDRKVSVRWAGGPPKSHNVGPLALVVEVALAEPKGETQDEENP